MPLMKIDAEMVGRQKRPSRSSGRSIVAEMAGRNPWDNALTESAIGTVQIGLARRHIFRTRDQARLAIFDYTEAFHKPDPRPQRARLPQPR